MEQLGVAIEAGKRSGAITLAAGPAHALVAAAAVNRRRLPLAGVRLRLQGEPTGDHAAVRVRWRLAGVRASSVVDMRFAVRSGAVVVTAIGGEGRALPWWLTTPMRLGRGGSALVFGAEARPGLVRGARRATRDVRRVLPGWRDRWVIVAPRTPEQYDAVLGAPPGQYAAVAAVTSTVDGSGRRDVPVQVVLNPVVFGAMTAPGERVVLAHEATHVAVGAAATAMPLWLVEGFADYVALRGVDVPTAAAIDTLLTRAGRHGVPRRLPGREAFASSGPRLGAAYESAWLACRLLVRRGGERRLVAFYRAVDRGSSVAGELERRYRLSPASLTRAWRTEVSHWVE